MEEYDEILEEATPTETQSEIQPEVEPKIYTGPNIPAFALFKYQVFQGGLPAYVKRAIEKLPEIGELIVRVSELEAMRAKISKSGTNEARLFYSVQEDAKKFNTDYRKVQVRGRN